MTDQRHWTLVIHGGSGIIDRSTLSAEADAAARVALGRALDAGAAILAGGGTAIDAVQAAIEMLEDDPAFNAGHGAALTFEGGVELDAAIMEGTGRRAGAVAGVTTARHPVALARAVMEHSPHVLLAGAGAERFASEQGIERIDNDWFVIPARRRQLESMKADDDWFDVDMKYGTVGAVACDMAGHVAAATSTGGVTGKRWGRIGDSPLIGAGTYADDRSVAVSATGSGEFFIRESVGHEIGARVRMLGESLQQAADTVIASVKALGGTGGVIATGPGGEAVWSFATPGMYRGSATSAGERIVAIYGDEA
ncbi:asparaginase [Sphingomonas sp. Leaf339]|uniref:isoaspartyl peptidase/L-asparaginase family protein n=1 Tax=Sphingomonas sp. Leaf339 TaxID=1736343 RepID=UPI0006FC9D3B|nr:isoaspartyl peptidase/L-asparaginase [Sphingomonas sp. Leaf339]KQU47289.1 asparaginase [Sphingomonas sp. Leaf339]